MARQKGILKLTGALGELSFYYLNGEPVARKKGFGFNGKHIKSSPRMARVRENGSEFKHCALVNQAVRRTMHPLYAGFRFTYLHSRMQGLFSRIQKMDKESKRGERTVYGGLRQDEGRRLLMGFEFTPQCRLEKIFPFKGRYDEAQQRYTFTNVQMKKVDFAEGATHLSLQMVVVDFDFETLKSKSVESQEQFFTPDIAEQDISLVLPAPLDIHHTSMVFVGVRFYQEVNGAMMVFNADDAVGFTLVSINN